MALKRFVHRSLISGLSLLAPAVSWAGNNPPLPNTLRQDPARGGYEPEVVYNARDQVLVDSLLPIDAAQSTRQPLNSKKTPGIVLYENAPPLVSSTTPVAVTPSSLVKPLPPPLSFNPKLSSLPPLPLLLPELPLPPNNFQFGQEKLRFPLTAPAPITAWFGLQTNPLTKLQTFNRGVNLKAPEGTIVLAAFSGRVLNTGILGELGQTVILGHGAQARTRYGHLASIMVKPGQWVQQGDLLGTVGKTGKTTGSQLHFELWQLFEKTWQALDPKNLLKFELPGFKR